MKAMLILIFCVTLGHCTTSGQAFISVMAELSAQTQHTIDDGLELLQEMLHAITHEYHITTAADAAALQELESQLEPLKIEVDKLQNECMDCDNELAYMEEEYQRNRAFIDWLEARMKANGNRIETLKWLRCESNKEWFNFLKSSKMMLKFIEFMRTSLQNYQSFTEIKSFLPKLDFLKNEMEMDIQSMLLQLKDFITDEADQLEETTEVSDEQIVLNMNDASKSRDINAVRNQLIEILNNIEKSIKAKMNRSQTNEIVSSLRVADFIYQLELESNQFDQTLTQLSDNLGDNPEAALKEKESQCTEGREKLQKLILQFNQIDNQVTQKRISNEQTAGRLEHQHSLIVEIIEQYVQGIHQVAIDYKVRTQDWIDNSSFDPNPFFDTRQLKAQFGDKEAGLNAYVEGIVKGSVNPVTEAQVLKKILYVLKADVFEETEPEQMVIGADTVAPTVEPELVPEPELVVNEAIADEPVSDEPVADEPVVEEAVVEEAVVEEAVALEAAVEEAAVEESTAAEPVEEQPVEQPQEAPANFDDQEVDDDLWK